MKKIFTICSAFAFMASIFTGCDEGGQATLNVTLNDRPMTFTVYEGVSPSSLMNITPTPSQLTYGDYDFSGSADINLEDDLFQQVAQYIDNPIEFKVNSAKIQFAFVGLDDITTDSKVTNLYIKADIDGTPVGTPVSIAEITNLQTAANRPQLMELMVQVMNNVAAGETVTVFASGSITDLRPSGIGGALFDVSVTPNLTAKVIISK